MKIIEQHTVEIYCHTCDGTGEVEEEHYPDREKIKVVCPECNGKKYVTVVSIQTEDELSFP